MLGQRHRLHCYLRVIMLTHDGRRLQTDRAVTEGSTLGTAGHDTDVLGHEFILHSHGAASRSARPRVRAEIRRGQQNSNISSAWSEIFGLQPSATSIEI